MFEQIEYPSPVGVLTLIARANELHALAFPEHAEHVRAKLLRAHSGESITSVATLPHFTRALDRYFAGDLTALDAIRVAPHGTKFQTAVWTSLRKIGAGATWSYADLARSVNSPAAVRAVGRANGANPIAIILPCHRVIGSDGSLTGYGGGLDRKRWLLDHEQQGR